MALRRDIEQFLKSLPEGWEYRKTRACHYRITGPNGQLVFTGTTPSDPRSIKNLKAQILRMSREPLVAPDNP